MALSRFRSGGHSGQLVRPVARELPFGDHGRAFGKRHIPNESGREDCGVLHCYAG